MNNNLFTQPPRGDQAGSYECIKISFKFLIIINELLMLITEFLIHI